MNNPVDSNDLKNENPEIHSESEKNGNSKQKEQLNLVFSFKEMIHLFKSIIIKRTGILNAIELEIDRKIETLQAEGKMTKEEGEELSASLKKEISDWSQRFNDRIDAGIYKTLKALKIASVNDLRLLEQKLDKILDQVESLIEQDSASGKKEKPKPKMSGKQTKSKPKNTTKKIPKTEKA